MVVNVRPKENEEEWAEPYSLLKFLIWTLLCYFYHYMILSPTNQSPLSSLIPPTLLNFTYIINSIYQFFKNNFFKLTYRIFFI